MDLKDKVIVITGASGRLGTTFCRTVLHAGGKLVATDLNKPAAQATLAGLVDTHGTDNVLPLSVDTTDAGSIDRCIDAALAHFGKVDALVNNAYPRNERYGRRFESVTYSDFVDNVGMHAGGYFLACQRFLEHFKRQGHGNIVNMSSIYGVVAPRFGIYAGTEMTMPVEYAVIKAGIIHLTKYIASYHRGMRIRCNAISPGGIRDGHSKEFLAQYAADASDKGMLEPTDISGALAFLLSDASAYVNGQNIVVDDGWTL